MATAKRKYYGQAHAAKCYRGSKSINLVFERQEASLAAEKLLRAVNDGRSRIDLAIYIAPKSGEKARMTITSPVASQRK
jgi:hypothetical protein